MQQRHFAHRGARELLLPLLHQRKGLFSHATPVFAMSSGVTGEGGCASLTTTQTASALTTPTITSRRYQASSSSSTETSDSRNASSSSSSEFHRSHHPQPQQQQQHQRASTSTRHYADPADAEGPASWLDDGSASPASSTTAAPTSDSPFTPVEQSHKPATSISEGLLYTDNSVTVFFDEKDAQMADFVRRQNEESVLMPPRPEDETPEEFERVRRSQRLLVRFNDPDTVVHAQRYNYVPLPPTTTHPWVERTKHGRYVQHGDGMLNVVGTGEVGFDDSFAHKPALPKSWRGLQRISVLGSRLPLRNGAVSQDLAVRQSVALTGRGLFATRDIKKGEILMIVDSTAQDVGINDEQTRLIEMCTHILRSAADALAQGDHDEVTFLHNWILTGQLSSLVERWRSTATDTIIDRIGGPAVLEQLELHREHIPRLAAILYMNSFLVESSHAERRGVAYWPEAALLNHSCAPNATYEVVPEHMFTESEFYMGTTDEQLQEFESDNIASAAAMSGTNGVPGSAAAGGGGGVGSSSSSSTSSASATKDASNNSSATTTGEQQQQHQGSSSSTTTLTHHHHHHEDGHECDHHHHHHEYKDLTPAGASTYLFCCRATADVAAGQEVLISYVPTAWPFDQRQEVLQDRYKFRCKCPRCAPPYEARHNAYTRLMIPLIILLVALRTLVELSRRGIEEDDRVTREKSRDVMTTQMGLVVGEMPSAYYQDDPYAKTSF